jgi:Peptidase family M28
MKTFMLSICIFFALDVQAQVNQTPVLSNLFVSRNFSNETIIRYDVSDNENDLLEIIVQYSTDGGHHFADLLLPQATGDIGYPVTPGLGKMIRYANYFSLTGPVLVRLTALDRQPIDVAYLVAQIDSNALKQRMSFVEGIRHRIDGAPKLKAVQDSILHLFEAERMGVREGNFVYSNYNARNLIADKPSYTGSRQSVIVDAHYDSVNNSPGADDNGSGTVGMMEIAAQLSRFPSKKGLRFIGFDLEEPGLIGSQNYVNNLAPTDTILGVFNFEMIGFYDTTSFSQTLPAGFGQLFPAATAALAADFYRGNFISNVGNANSASLVNRFRTAANTYVPKLKVLDLVVPGNGSIAPDLRRSDHAPFWIKNLPALMLTDGANFRNINYHTENDVSANLNFGFMQQVTQATLAAMIDLAEVQHGSWAVVPADILSISDDNGFNTAYRIVMDRAGSKIRVLTDEAFGAPVLAAQISFYAQDGRLLAEKVQDIRANTETVVLTSDALPSGPVFVAIRTQNGDLIWSGKL